MVHLHVHAKSLFILVYTLQVCPPGLHLSLGIFQRLFDLMEEECHLLDLKTSTITSDYVNANTFDAYIKTKTAIKTLEEEKKSLLTEMEQARQVLAYF